MTARSWRAVGALVVLVVLLVAGALLGRSGDPEPGSDPGARSTSAGSPSAPTATASTTRTTAATPTTDPASGLPWVDPADLPAEARRTLDLIEAGGPFPYPGKDGSTFGNFEGILPREPRGYYAEYTVPTPGSRDRGARRIIAGDRGERYWTADHYAHFARVRR